MSTLIVLRGNSGSGKSTVARALQRDLGAVWIEQDYLRRSVLGESGNYSPLSVELLEQSAALALAHGRTVIVEGMLNPRKYSCVLHRLCGGHSGRCLFYAWDLSLAETLHRHATRPGKQMDFGEKQMRSWYRGWDPLEGIAERRITAEESALETVARIERDVLQE